MQNTPIVHKIHPPSTSKKEVICSIISEDGMRKEATVLDFTGETWKIVCDEGPYLNGADSAPPPLAYFSAGMAFGFISQLNLLAEETGILIEDYTIIQDNYYTIEGSAIRGTMISGGLPVDVKIEIKSKGSETEIEQLIQKAKAQNPVYRYLDTQLENGFQLFHNDQKIGITSVSSSTESIPKLMKNGNYIIGQDFNKTGTIVSKQVQVETLFNVAGGKADSLKESQKRMLHIRAITTPHGDGLAETKVQIFKPLGSTFQFLCDLPTSIGGAMRTPSSLAYASAGIGFCFMTQIGRYAKIKKYDLAGYSIEQTTNFEIEAAQSKVSPINTITHIQSDLTDEIAENILKMSEQTCFLHGAIKGQHEVKFNSGGIKS